MILFINGAFGIGKTTLSAHLLRRLPESILFDAEEVGSMLFKVLGGVDPRDDFQHYPMWRTLTVATALALRKEYGRPLLMPMCLCHRPYFDEIMTGLRDEEPDVRHFCLIAPAPVIHERLLARGDAEDGWAWQRTERCVAAHRDPAFAVHLDALRSPEEFADEVLAKSKL